MAIKILTDKQVHLAKPAEKEYLLADGAGLFLRVRPTSAKDWLFVYTFAGKRRKLGLGSLDSVTLTTARQQAERHRTAVATGSDPQLLRKQQEEEQEALRRANEAESARITVKELFERWASVDLARRKDVGAEVRRMFEKDVLPTIGAMAVEDVRKGHITAVTDALLARGVTRMSKLIFSLMRQMFRFAVDRDIIEFEPSAAIRKAKIGGKDTERDRVLTEDEIKSLAKQLPNANLLPSTCSAVWLALSTCCRIGELLQARWEHVDLNRRTWWIPPEASKNGKAHTVQLSAFSVEQFQALKDLADEELDKRRKTNPKAEAVAWIYPNRHDDGPVCSKTITKQLGDRQRPGQIPMSGRAKTERAAALALPGGKWGPHDLRRTGATMMVALGVIPEVAERCLNHMEQNRVKRTYQRHSYENEMREAWRLLGERIELLTIADSGNVVTADFGRAA